jgi:hypothetical protein
MAKKSINLTGTSGKTYDLEKIATENTRLDSDSQLLVEIWEWNPEANNEDHRKPNPPSPAVGRIWLSKLVDLSIVNEKYKVV